MEWRLAVGWTVLDSSGWEKEPRRRIGKRRREREERRGKREEGRERGQYSPITRKGVDRDFEVRGLPC
jgi:hypothetical protein